MFTKFLNFLWQRCGAAPLILTADRAVPGMLLETEWPSPFLVALNLAPRFLREDGFAWEHLGLSEADYETVVADANIIQESVNDKLSLEGDVSLPQVGFSLDGRLTSKFSGVFRITGVSARVFLRSTAPYQLMQALLAVKESDPPLWKWVNDDFLICESYYVTSFTAELKSEVGLSARAEFEKAGLKITAGIKLDWISDSTFRLTGTATVPVAVRGLKI